MNLNSDDYADQLIKLLYTSVIFTALNLLTSMVFKAINNKFFIKSYSEEEVRKKKVTVEESRRYMQKINESIYSQANANHLEELNKGTKGLIVHLALYGSKKSLKKIINNFLYMKVDLLYPFIEDIDNEVFNVTIPTRYLIKNDPNLSYSSILFHQVPKTRIMGYTNPIFSSNKKKPYILIK